MGLVRLALIIAMLYLVWWYLRQAVGTVQQRRRGCNGGGAARRGAGFGSGSSRRRGEHTDPRGAGGRGGGVADDAVVRQACAVLGVAPGATPQQIREAYQRLVQQYHPDKVASMGPELREVAERKMKELNAAYAALTRNAKAHR